MARRSRAACPVQGKASGLGGLGGRRGRGSQLILHPHIYLARDIKSVVIPPIIDPKSLCLWDGAVRIVDRDRVKPDRTDAVGFHRQIIVAGGWFLDYSRQSVIWMDEMPHISPAMRFLFDRFSPDLSAGFRPVVAPDHSPSASRAILWQSDVTGVREIRCSASRKGFATSTFFSIRTLGIRAMPLRPGTA